MYDVIVIGAGPAGSTCAKVLSEKGCRVLLVEKFKMPRYKSCSEVLITVEACEVLYVFTAYHLQSTNEWKSNRSFRKKKNLL